MIDERLKQIADHYGLDKQLDMLQEECAELIQAVSKYKRTRITAIVEEMADVYIMLYQITYLLNKEVASVDVEDFIAMWMEKKIRRQLERMKGGAASPQGDLAEKLKERIEESVCKYCQMNKHCELCEISRVFQVVTLTTEEQKGGTE